MFSLYIELKTQALFIHDVVDSNAASSVSVFGCQSSCLTPRDTVHVGSLCHTIGTLKCFKTRWQIFNAVHCSQQILWVLGYRMNVQVPRLLHNYTARLTPQMFRITLTTCILGFRLGLGLQNEFFKCSAYNTISTAS